jgi:glycosyltransferase involved in cell wall biosynthesis
LHPAVSTEELGSDGERRAHPRTPASSALLTVIVATLNEEVAIERCLRRILDVLPESGEIVVVDGGSDRTGEIVVRLAAEFPAIRYLRNEHDRGKGHAVHVGLNAGAGEIFVQIDADLQFYPEEIPRMLEPLQQGHADLVLGSRFMRGSVRLPGSTSWLRTFGNVTTSLFASLLTGQRMTDVLAGMKAWRKEVVERIDLHCQGVAYDAELPVKTALAGLRIDDVPVTTDARSGGQSAISVVRDGIKILLAITCFRLGIGHKTAK